MITLEIKKNSSNSKTEQALENVAMKEMKREMNKKATFFFQACAILKIRNTMRNLVCS